VYIPVRGRSSVFLGTVLVDADLLMQRYPGFPLPRMSQTISGLVLTNCGTKPNEVGALQRHRSGSSTPQNRVIRHLLHVPLARHDFMHR
jgi:hypothetical protein